MSQNHSQIEIHAENNLSKTETPFEIAKTESSLNPKSRSSRGIEKPVAVNEEPRGLRRAILFESGEIPVSLSPYKYFIAGQRRVSGAAHSGRVKFTSIVTTVTRPGLVICFAGRYRGPAREREIPVVARVSSRARARRRNNILFSRTNNGTRAAPCLNGPNCPRLVFARQTPS